jgi:hypothetical protein
MGRRFSFLKKTRATLPVPEFFFEVTMLNQAAPRVCIHSDYGNPFKVNSEKELPIDRVLKKITEPYLLLQIEQVSSFHGYLSTGAFIGIQMLKIAKKVLDADHEEQLYVTCETYNCLPDPFQILAGCTIGNKKTEDQGLWQDGSRCQQEGKR